MQTTRRGATSNACGPPAAATCRRSAASTVSSESAHFSHVSEHVQPRSRVQWPGVGCAAAIPPDDQNAVSQDSVDACSRIQPESFLHLEYNPDRLKPLIIT